MSSKHQFNIWNSAYSASLDGVEVEVCSLCQHVVEITLGRTRSATADAIEALRAQWQHRCLCGQVGCSHCMEQCSQCMEWVCRRHGTRSECGLVEIDGAPMCLHCALKHIIELGRAAGVDLMADYSPPVQALTWRQRARRWWNGVFASGSID